MNYCRPTKIQPHSSLWGKLEKYLIEFHCLKALNDRFELQFLESFIFKPYQRHW